MAGSMIFRWNEGYYQSLYKSIIIMKRYLIYLIGLLTGCTAGPVEEMPETARLVAVSFGKPDLGVPELLTRAEETVFRHRLFYLLGRPYVSGHGLPVR